MSDIESKCEVYEDLKEALCNVETAKEQQKAAVERMEERRAADREAIVAGGSRNTPLWNDALGKVRNADQKLTSTQNLLDNLWMKFDCQCYMKFKRDHQCYSKDQIEKKYAEYQKKLGNLKQRIDAFNHASPEEHAESERLEKTLVDIIKKLDKKTFLFDANKNSKDFRNINSNVSDAAFAVGKRGVSINPKCQDKYPEIEFRLLNPRPLRRP